MAHVNDPQNITDPSDPAPYAESLELYDKAAWEHEFDPMSMSAHIQMINCHLRLGNVNDARMALQRAKWALPRIPAEAFDAYAPEEDRAYWQYYLAWLERTPTLNPTEKIRREMARGQ
jgi:hypothetical protein